MKLPDNVKKSYGLTDILQEIEKKNNNTVNHISDMQ